MTIEEAIARARAGPFEMDFDDGVEPFEFDFEPALTMAQLDEVRREFCPTGIELPKDFLHMATLCGGLGCEYEFSLKGHTYGQFVSDAMPNAIAIALDGFGNSWNIDLKPTQKELSSIYYVCHDPPVICFQCLGLAQFVNELCNCYVRPFESKIRDVEDGLSMGIYRENLDLLPRSVASTSTDPELADFAISLPDDYVVYDFRNPTTGSGFTWAHSREQIGMVIRHPQLMLFGIPAQTPTKPKRSIIKRLLGT